MVFLSLAAFLPILDEFERDIPCHLKKDIPRLRHVSELCLGIHVRLVVGCAGVHDCFFFGLCA